MSQPSNQKGKGRPTKYNSKFVVQAIKLCKKGFTDEELADFFGVATSTLYLWKTKYPEFSEALKDSKAFCDADVEASLYNRALGYDYDEVKKEVSQVGEKKTQRITTTNKKVIADTTAQIFWLKNRQPDRWRDRQPEDNKPVDDLAGSINKLIDRLPG